MPFGPRTAMYSTFWPSASDLKLAPPWISLKWAKRSSPPAAGVMKPKPLASLNHLTVPVCLSDICNFLHKQQVTARPKWRARSAAVKERAWSLDHAPKARKKQRTTFFEWCSGAHITRVGGACRIGSFPAHRLADQHADQRRVRDADLPGRLRDLVVAGDVGVGVGLDHVDLPGGGDAQVETGVGADVQRAIGALAGVVDVRGQAVLQPAGERVADAPFAAIGVVPLGLVGGDA